MGKPRGGPILQVMRRAVRAIGVAGWCLAVATAAAADGRDDARRESLLELRFTENLNLTGRALDAEVVGDTAILTAAANRGRSGAGRAAGDRSGIRQVDNQLTVDPPRRSEAGKEPALTSEEREEREAGRERPHGPGARAGAGRRRPPLPPNRGAGAAGAAAQQVQPRPRIRPDRVRRAGV